MALPRQLSHDQTPAEVSHTILSQRIKYVQMMFTDLTGVLRSLEERAESLIPYSHFGVGIDGSSIPGYANVERSDVRLVPDLGTFNVFAFPELDAGFPTIARVMCHFELPDQGRHMADPRNVLQAVIEKARVMGFEPYMMAELEFFLMKDGKPNDRGGYLCMPPDDLALPYRHALAKACEEAGLRVKRIHHECAPGQNELELDFAPAAKNADDTLVAMWLSRVLAPVKADGAAAVYDPKYKPDMAGNGLHQHIRLENVDGVNVFAGDADEWLSQTALHFIAGMIHYAPDIIAIQSRSLGSFERMRPGHEAPSVAAWGFMNRSAMIRVPLVTKGNETKARVEFRAGDASGSPQLLQAAILLAGLKGIEMSMACPPKVDGNVDLFTPAQLAERGLKRLPNDPATCATLLRESAFAEELLGPVGVEFLVAQNDTMHTAALEAAVVGGRKRAHA